MLNEQNFIMLIISRSFLNAINYKALLSIVSNFIDYKSIVKKVWLKSNRGTKKSCA